MMAPLERQRPVTSEGERGADIIDLAGRDRDHDTEPAELGVAAHRAEITLEAVRYLVGAALLDRKAAALAQDLPAECWPTAWAPVPHAIGQLRAEAIGIDVLTLADRLHRNGVDDIGIAALNECQCLVPSISGAHAYADVLRRHARFDRLTHLGADLAAAAAVGDEDRITIALDAITAHHDTTDQDGTAPRPGQDDYLEHPDDR